MGKNFSFSVVSGRQVNKVINGREVRIMQIVESAYRLHGEGRTVNPDSYFLRFPERPSSRIIALPASVKGDVDVHGIKWISSFPENVVTGVPRASAVLILNDAETGYPFACLESSIISAARTAASAALAASELSRKRGERPTRVGFIGTGIIARYIHAYLAGAGFMFEEVGIYDLSAEHMTGFEDYVRRTEYAKIIRHESVENLIGASNLIVLATIAGEPHVTDITWFDHNPLVLHISLRDLSPDIILESYNVVDDIEHCMKENTSVHLTEQTVGNRDFVAGTLYDVLTGEITPPTDRPVVFSPFGLGVLDLAVAKYVYDETAAFEELLMVPDFFHEMKRYG